MSSQSPFVGTPLGYADTINGAGLALSGIDCGGGVRAGAKCFVATGLQYWTLTVSAAVVDHIAVETALNFPAMRWILDATPGTGTVTSVSSGNGLLTVANPTTTPVLTPVVVTVANVAALAALVTVVASGVGYPTGTQAFVVSTGGLYVLRAAVSASPDSVYVVATSDDVSRQWVDPGLKDRGQVSIYGAPINMAATGVTVLFPPCPFFMTTPASFTLAIAAKDGTVTVGPTVRLGTNATNDNIGPAASLAGFTTQAVGTRVLLSNATPNNVDVDMTLTGLRLEVTVAATLGTATVLTARPVTTIALRQ